MKKIIFLSILKKITVPKFSCCKIIENIFSILTKMLSFNEFKLKIDILFQVIFANNFPNRYDFVKEFRSLTGNNPFKVQRRHFFNAF